MRSRVLALVVAMMASIGTTPAQEAPKADRCDIVLKYWQQVMASVPAFEADCKRTVSLRRFGTAEVHEGKYRYLKAPTVCASVELHPAGVAKSCVKLVLNDDGVCDFQYDAKQLNVTELPKEQRGPGSNPLSLLFNPVPFEFSWARLLSGQLTPEKMNPHYTELTLFGRDERGEKAVRDRTRGRRRVLLLPRSEASQPEGRGQPPRRPADALEDDVSPAQIWFQQANQDEVPGRLPA